MTPLALLREGEYVGVRQLRGALTKFIHMGRKTVFVTEHGKPKKVLVPYELFLEILELVEDLKDKALLQMVKESRKAQGEGKSIPWGDVKRELHL